MARRKLLSVWPPLFLPVIFPTLCIGGLFLVTAIMGAIDDELDLVLIVWLQIIILMGGWGIIFVVEVLFFSWLFKGNENLCGLAMWTIGIASLIAWVFFVLYVVAPLIDSPFRAP